MSDISRNEWDIELSVKHDFYTFVMINHNRMSNCVKNVLVFLKNYKKLIRFL